MGFLVIERHVFYVQGREFADKRSPGQSHLFLKNRRIPWENSYFKSVVYLPQSQLSDTPPGPGGRSAGIETMRQYLMGGERYGHPRLIVADIHSPQEIMTKSQLGQVLLASYAQRYSRFSKEHRVRRPNERGNEAWFLFDPSRPGRKGLKRDTYLRLAQQVLPKEAIARKMYKGMEGRRRRFNLDKIIVLGIGYRLAYYHGPTSSLADLGTDTKLQRRVNGFLAQQAGVRGEEGEQWFVLGKFKTPKVSVRPKPTPLGRKRRIVTYQHGVGLRPVNVKEHQAIRPLFMVVAKSENEAKEAAQKRFEKMLKANPSRRRELVLLHEKWLDSGKAVLPRRVWDRYRTKG